MKQFKCQCVHSDTGLCETCFKYESALTEMYQKGVEDSAKVAEDMCGSCAGEYTGHGCSYAKAIRKLNNQKGQR